MHFTLHTTVKLNLAVKYYYHKAQSQLIK